MAFFFAGFFLDLAFFGFDFFFVAFFLVFLGSDFFEALDLADGFLAFFLLSFLPVSDVDAELFLAFLSPAFFFAFAAFVSAAFFVLGFLAVFFLAFALASFLAFAAVVDFFFVLAFFAAVVFFFFDFELLVEAVPGLRRQNDLTLVPSERVNEFTNEQPSFLVQAVLERPLHTLTLVCALAVLWVERVISMIAITAKIPDIMFFIDFGMAPVSVFRLILMSLMSV